VVKVNYSLPESVPENAEENEEFLKAVHHALLNVNILDISTQLHKY
jgi:hypothetical protein